ncbi:Csu type fimbrial protein [Sphingomonas metalli]|nr:spore coat protein U domain-containing protein [Sphingomonas metalli]
MRILWFSPAVAATAYWVAAPVGAETTKSFQVSAQIVAGCIVVANGQGSWGAIDLGSVAGTAGASAQGSLISTAGAGVSIECTPGLSATLAIDTGDHPAGSQRRLGLMGGTATIPYQLYVDGAATAFAGSTPLSFTAGPRLVPIRAVATLAAPAAAGRYTDTVRVTLSW